MVTCIDVHLQSVYVSVYWLWLLLYVSAVSVEVVIVAIYDMHRQEFSLFERVIFTIRICNFSNFVAVCTDDTDTPVSCNERFRHFWRVCSNLLPISSNVSSVRTWRRRFTFLFFTEPVSLKLFSLSPKCTGIRHRSSWNIYLKFASCFRTRLSAFHVRILNIHTFTQWEFLSRHVTNLNNHNNYTYSTNV